MVQTASRAQRIETAWGRLLSEAFFEYVRIPCLSPLFAPRWEAEGHIEKAILLLHAWAAARQIEGLSASILRLPARTPLLWVEVPARASNQTVLLYGHLDKQPPMEGWREGLGPFEPVIDGERLYGRGAADDGYALFAALTALEMLEEEGRPRPRALVLIEASEESGSPDLPAHVEALTHRLGRPDLVVCLDSGCGDYERLWLTTSLRGLVAGTLEVSVLKEGVHSGDAGGVVPSSFRIARTLLGRLEEAPTGHVRLDALHVDVPPLRQAQARQAAAILGDHLWRRFPWVAGTSAPSRPLHEMVLDRTWRPALEVVGADGLPPTAAAGNVLRPMTRLKLSLRLPPTGSASSALAQMKDTLEADPPAGARVRFLPETPASGWEAPPEPTWLAEALEVASRRAFGHPAAFQGEGGTIPFMKMLAEVFPEAAFVVTGVLGPGANAHGPNEFLHLTFARRLTDALACVLEAHGRLPRPASGASNE